MVWIELRGTAFQCQVCQLSVRLCHVVLADPLFYRGVPLCHAFSRDAFRMAHLLAAARFCIRNY